MALALRQAAELKPALRLAQAISEFEADLSDAEKHRFRQDKSKPPQPDDVMRLTAEFDRSVQRQGNQRCFGPRLTNFLQGVQQFASIGDIVIGGSQFLPACGVWTLVRFSLMSVVQYKSYVDKMSLLFMEIGRSAPSYQRMALLFPQSKYLQTNVLEYFILVVQLCHRMLKHSKKSGLQHFLDSTNDSSNTERKDLERWSLAIKDEMHIAMARANQDESQKSSAFRFLSRQDIEKMRSFQQQTARLQILDAISTYDYQIPWKQLRKVGSTTILTGSDEYSTWKNLRSSNTFILSGRLGAGKSIVLANIVDDLFLNPLGNQALAVYYFCRYDIPESLIARTIIGAIARQLLKDKDLSALPSDLNRDHYATDDITAVIAHMLTAESAVYMVLDGIYECETKTQLEVLGCLAELQSRFRLSLCLSARTRHSPAQENCAAPIHVSMPWDNPDIENHIEEELEGLLASRKLVVQDPSIVLEIRNQLVSKSEGMFLWVHLQILLLCLEDSDHGIRKALEELPLPSDLGKTYARLLDKTTTTVKDSTRTRFLSLVVAAFRPMTIRELQESLSVTPGDTSWDESKLINDMTNLIFACGGLLMLDEEEETIRLVHTSAFQFLKDEGQYLVNNIHETMVCTILTYLHYPIFETRISKSTIPTVDATLLSAGIIASTLQPNTKAQQLAIKLLRLRKTKERDISKLLAERRPKIVHVSEYHFQHYARQHWLRHLCKVEVLNVTASDLLAELFQSGKLSLDDDEETSGHINDLYPLQIELFEKTEGIPGFPFICWAVQQGHVPLVKSLLDSLCIESVEGLPEQINPFRVAIEIGHQDMVLLFLKSGLCKNYAIRSKLSSSPAIKLIQIAVDCEFHDTASRLLKENLENWSGSDRPEYLSDWILIDRSMCDKSGRSPLHYAGLVFDKILFGLVADPFINGDLMDTRGITPLQFAIVNRADPRAISMLLQIRHPQPYIKDGMGRTPLHLACEVGCPDTVQVLASDSRFKINAQDVQGRTALWIAVQRSDISCLKMLLWGELYPRIYRLWRGLNPNLVNRQGRTPLHRSALGDDEAVVKELLKIDTISIQELDMYGRTAGYYAQQSSVPGIRSLSGILLQAESSKEDDVGRK